MKSLKIITGVGIAALTTALVGCSTNCVISTYAPYQASQTEKLGSTFNTNVIVANTGGMVVNGLTNGRTMLTNNTNGNQTVRYHFTWSSADGSPQGENTPWTPLELTPYATQVIQSVAPNAQATNFQVQVCQ